MDGQLSVSVELRNLSKKRSYYSKATSVPKKKSRNQIILVSAESFRDPDEVEQRLGVALAWLHVACGGKAVLEPGQKL